VRIAILGGGVAQLAAGPLPLRAGPPGGPDPWAAWISAPDTEDGLGPAQERVARTLAAGACLVAVGGTALTRRLLCEAARLEHGAATMLVEDGSEDSVVEDRARTAILSGRADLVGTQND